MKHVNVTEIRSEIERLARALREGVANLETMPPYKLNAIFTRLEEGIFPTVDSIQDTVLRRELVEDVEKLIAVSEQLGRAWEHVDRDELDLWRRCLVEADGMLAGVISESSVGKLRTVIREELLREQPDLAAGNPQKYANDSVDAAVDAYLGKIGQTMEAGSDPNKEENSEDGKPEFSAVDFASDVANLLDRADTLIDVKGTIVRRALNRVTEKYGADAAADMLQVLDNNFDIDVESKRDEEAERDEMTPAAVGAGGEAGAAAAGGGGGGGG